MRRINGLQIAMPLCFILLIYTPIIWMSVLGSESEEYGEIAYEVPVFSIQSWMKTDFQQGFEAWFSHSYPGRRMALHTYTELESKESDVSHIAAQLWPFGGTEYNLSVVPEDAASDIVATPFFPEYERNIPKAENQSPYQGTDTIIVGKDGVLYENIYINEAFGLSPRYTDVTDAQLEARANQLLFIQEALAARGIAFSMVITPNKAAHYPEYVPAWYLEKYSVPEGYVRPYTRFLSMLEETGVNHVDSATVFASRGLAASFPMTGTHWSPLSSLVVTQELISDYTRQTGILAPNFQVTGVEKIAGTYPSSELEEDQDIFRLLYESRPSEQAHAILDPYYFRPIYEIVNAKAAPIQGIYFQGGSFTGQISSLLEENTIASGINWEWYNSWESDDWESLLNSVSYVVFELNEQFVFNMGGNVPAVGVLDLMPLETETYNVYDSLYTYLSS